jgi:hypothetical protein
VISPSRIPHHASRILPKIFPLEQAADGYHRVDIDFSVSVFQPFRFSPLHPFPHGAGCEGGRR